MKKTNIQNIHKQKGIALVMSLIMLLLITIIGVASVRNTNIDTQVSGNSMFSLMVFQGAESALGKAGVFFNINNAAQNSDVPVDVPDSFFNPAETVNGGTKLISSAQMAYERRVEGSLFGSIPNSTNFNYQIFRTTAESRIEATAAKAIHIEGIAVTEAAQ